LHSTLDASYEVSAIKFISYELIFSIKDAV
jgi:hypothetical protein